MKRELCKEETFHLSPRYSVQILTDEFGGVIFNWLPSKPRVGSLTDAEFNAFEAACEVINRRPAGRIKIILVAVNKKGMWE